MPVIEANFSFSTVSEANCFEHWAKKYARHKIQKYDIAMYFLHQKPIITLPCKITMIRIAPRKLDSDNLVMAFKWIKDAISDQLIPGHRPGMVDSDPRLSWAYDQRKGQAKEYGTRIQFDF